MRRRPPRSTPTCTLCPYTTLFRSNSRESSPRVATERCLVGSDSRTPHALDIVEGGDKSDRFQNWRRPGLELVRRGSIFDVIAAEGCDHLAAAEHRWRSEEHTSELQSLMRISYAVFCLQKKTNDKPHKNYSSNNTTQYQNT